MAEFKVKFAPLMWKSNRHNLFILLSPMRKMRRVYEKIKFSSRLFSYEIIQRKLSKEKYEIWNLFLRQQRKHSLDPVASQLNFLFFLQVLEDERCYPPEKTREASPKAHKKKFNCAIISFSFSSPRRVCTRFSSLIFTVFLSVLFWWEITLERLLIFRNVEIMVSPSEPKQFLHSSYDRCERERRDDMEHVLVSFKFTFRKCLGKIENKKCVWCSWNVKERIRGETVKGKFFCSFSCSAKLFQFSSGTPTHSQIPSFAFSYIFYVSSTQWTSAWMPQVRILSLAPNVLASKLSSATKNSEERYLTLESDSAD